MANPDLSSLEAMQNWHPEPSPLPRDRKRPGLLTERVDGQEIKLDLNAELGNCSDFYKTHGLADFASQISADIKLSEETELEIREALKEGFDTIIFMPGAGLQEQSFDRIVAEMADKPGAWSTPDEQYTAPYFEPETKNSRIHNRPTDGPYLLCYKSEPIPTETKNQSPKQLEALFRERQWNSMTLPEYLIIRCREAEQRGNNDFDKFIASEVDQSQLSWLLDSEVTNNQGTEAIAAGWFTKLNQIRVIKNKVDRSYKRLGCRPTKVIPLF